MPGAAHSTSRPIVVMKFGGTSVADADGRAALATRVSEKIAAGRAPVVVVSAMGRSGDPYATDTLLGLVEGCADPRATDLIASVGETVSAVVVANDLSCSGVPARPFTGADAGIATDGVFAAASITEVRPAALLRALASGQVPVVAGFQGIGPDGHVTTLGRGGSDTTACALGVALGAESVEVYTDVDGVMSADPRACEAAEVLGQVTADELSQMARHGSRVVHAPAAELAAASGLDLRVRSTFSDHEGTLVSADIARYRPDRVATAVSHEDGVVRFVVRLPHGDQGGHTAQQATVYRAMADAGVSLDMFSPFDDALAFAVTRLDAPAAERVLTGLGMDHETRPSLAKVTLVGGGMHRVPGVMARVAETLAAAGIDVLQTADSHSTISVLVPSDHMRAAVSALHTAFELDGPKDAR